MDVFFEKLKLYQESNLRISTDPVFKQLDSNFKNRENKQNYDALVIYFRDISNRNKINISENAILLFSNEKGKLLFNSTLGEDLGGNSFENYTNGKIKYDNKYQKKSVYKSLKQIINVTIHCSKHHRYLYTSNLVGSAACSGEVSVA